MVSKDSVRHCVVPGTWTEHCMGRMCGRGELFFSYCTRKQRKEEQTKSPVLQRHRWRTCFLQLGQPSSIPTTSQDMATSCRPSVENMAPPLGLYTLLVMCLLPVTTALIPHDAQFSSSVPLPGLCVRPLSFLSHWSVCLTSKQCHPAVITIEDSFQLTFFLNIIVAMTCDSQ